jgi:hypothetical protein
MGGGGSQNIAHIFTHVNAYDPAKRILTRVSTFVFGEKGLPDDVGPVTEKTVTGAPMGPTLGRPTGKIGIQLETSQDVDDFVLLFEGRRFLVQRDSAVENELSETFGQPGGLKWKGYNVALPPPTDRFRMSALLRVSVQFKRNPHTGLYAGIFAVPMVFGFYAMPLTQHYALGLTAFQPDETSLVDTSVRVRL